LTAISLKADSESETLKEIPKGKGFIFETLNQNISHNSVKVATNSRHKQIEIKAISNKMLVNLANINGSSSKQPRNYFIMGNIIAVQENWILYGFSSSIKEQDCTRRVVQKKHKTNKEERENVKQIQANVRNYQALQKLVVHSNKFKQGND